jgi:DNA-binding transcriptional LysR family regulator
MNINLHHLQLFYYVAKAKGISSAVKIIPYGIQQPAVSQQLIQLEEDLAVKLFERRPFALTNEGERLYEFAASFFDNLELQLALIKDQAGVRVRFGCPSVISANYFPELIGIVIDKFPQVRPHITELEGYGIFAALINKEIDVAISMCTPPKSKSITSKKLLSIPMALIVPAKHRFATDGFWPKSDFINEKWIAIQDSSGGTQELRQGLSLLGISPQFVASTNSVEATLMYVNMGLGIALMAKPPENLLSKYNLAVLPVPDLFDSVSLTVSWHNDITVENKIVTYIHQTAKELSEKYIV